MQFAEATQQRVREAQEASAKAKAEFEEAQRAASSEGPSLSRCLMRWWQVSTGGTAGLGAGGPSARW